MTVVAQASRCGYDPAIHHRRSIRLRGHDYAGGGVYFVTLCVTDRRPLFGTVVNGRMALNDAGRAAAACWRAIPDHFPGAALDEWIVMPDHVHGIVRVGLACQAPAAAPAADTGTACRAPAFGRPIAGALGTIIGAFKAATSRAIRRSGTASRAPADPAAICTGTASRAPADPAAICTGTASRAPAIWQRNYYDIVVRDARALDNIRQYIRENPAHWDTLRYGEPRFFAGNRALLDLPMTAFLASRTGEKCLAPASWPQRPACVVSGFLSPMERAVFNACLADGTPMVWILARGLGLGMPHGHAMPCPDSRRALEQGRLLLLTPFDDTVTSFSAARAAWCNQYALHLAANAVIGRLAPDGMLACLLADLRHDIPVHYLE